MKKSISSFSFISAFFLLAVILFSCGQKEITKKLNKGYYFQSQKDVDSLLQSIDQYEEAVVLALEAMEGSFESQKLLGIELAFKKNYRRCADVLEKAREMKTDDATLHYYLGLCHTHLARGALDDQLKQDSVEKARKAFELGLEVNDKEPLLHYGMGVLLGFVIEDRAEAIEYLETAYQLDNEDVNVLFALANLYYQQGNSQQAASFYRKVISLRPADTQQGQQARKNLIALGQKP